MSMRLQAIIENHMDDVIVEESSEIEELVADELGYEDEDNNEFNKEMIDDEFDEGFGDEFDEGFDDEFDKGFGDKFDEEIVEFDEEIVEFDEVGDNEFIEENVEFDEVGDD